MTTRNNARLAQREEIPVASILGSISPLDCKLHCAVWNGRNQPLDVFARSWDEWVGWNRWRSEKHVFNRRYIFCNRSGVRLPQRGVKNPHFGDRQRERLMI